MDEAEPCALKRNVSLDAAGLVKIVPYKGTTVTRLNRDIVDELIYERIAVEAKVLRDFAPHCTPEHRALIRRHRRR